MKKIGRWFAGLFGRMMVLVMFILLIPYGVDLANRYLPDPVGEIRIQSAVLEQKLRSSQRLEVMTVEEEGILEARTSVIILGTVGSTTIRYRYTASVGIDLSKVILKAESDRIIFELPEPVILNDGIEALEINKHNLFSRAVEKSVEALLNEQRLKCRNQYLTEKEHSDRAWEETKKAFNETVCTWLENYGERHYSFEFILQSE